MNKARRTAVARIVAKLDAISEELTKLADAEQEAMDNTPESLQDTDRYLNMQDYIDAMEQGSSDASDLADSLRDIAEE